MVKTNKSACLFQHADEKITETHYEGMGGNDQPSLYVCLINS
jgi:hypothetical protein